MSNSIPLKNDVVHLNLAFVLARTMSGASFEIARKKDGLPDPRIFG